MLNKKFWATTFTLTGITVGAGILGIPYVFAKSGFLAGLFWLIVVGIIMIYLNLAIGEVTLRTNGRHQLIGYAEKYLGKWGKNTMFFLTIFGIYSALIAYMIGEGESLSKIIPGNIHPIIFGIIFWVIITLLLREGLRGLKKIETWGVLAVIIIIIGIFVWFVRFVKIENLATWNQPNFMLPIGIVLFALLGFTSIPELREEIKGQEKLLKRAIIIGTLIPIALYIMFSGIFIGVLGTRITEIATLSFGPLVTILGIFTMFTSCFVLSFCLKDAFKYDLQTKKSTNFLLTSILPLFLYVIITWFDLLSFTLILGIGGVISGGLTGILILLMVKRAKRVGNKKSEINVPINWIIITILSIILIAGIVSEFIH